MLSKLNLFPVLATTTPSFDVIFLRTSSSLNIVHQIWIGVSPLVTMHVAATASSRLTSSSPNVNGLIWGKTKDQKGNFLKHQIANGWRIEVDFQFEDNCIHRLLPEMHCAEPRHLYCGRGKYSFHRVVASPTQLLRLKLCVQFSLSLSRHCCSNSSQCCNAHRRTSTKSLLANRLCWSSTLRKRSREC